VVGEGPAEFEFVVVNGYVFIVLGGLGDFFVHVVDEQLGKEGIFSWEEEGKDVVGHSSEEVVWCRIGEALAEVGDELSGKLAPELGVMGKGSPEARRGKGDEGKGFIVMG